MCFKIPRTGKPKNIDIRVLTFAFTTVHWVNCCLILTVVSTDFNFINLALTVWFVTAKHSEVLDLYNISNKQEKQMDWEYAVTAKRSVCVEFSPSHLGSLRLGKNPGWSSANWLDFSRLSIFISRIFI